MDVLGMDVVGMDVLGMNPSGPAGPGYVVYWCQEPKGASFMAGEHMPEGPGNDTEREADPSFTFTNSGTQCTLSVVGRGRVSVKLKALWPSTHEEVLIKEYEQVSGFIVKSRDPTKQVPDGVFEIKIVYNRHIASFFRDTVGMSGDIKTTSIVWSSLSSSVSPNVRMVRPSFFRWAKAQGFDAIDDQY